ncbi:MAG TPA: V-type ATP synthase subunit D [Verrucomicrobiae bacterium]|nr:V-type ATP synthase subunit D [Verrucomicrobiae bacterium]
MAKLNVAPTKSNLLSLRRQLAFATEGYDLLEQKRQMLILELMSRLSRAREIEEKVAEMLRTAYAALRQAALDIGSVNLDRSALAVGETCELDLKEQHLMGLRIPKITVRMQPSGVRFGFGGTSANTDLAMLRFMDFLPRLAELAELQNAVLRLARELRKTQRRYNALSKIFIPVQRETIAYIAGTLEERDRESLIILKMIRNQLSRDQSDDCGSSQMCMPAGNRKDAGNGLSPRIQLNR